MPTADTFVRIISIPPRDSALLICIDYAIVCVIFANASAMNRS
jgi:hypothetical protein